MSALRSAALALLLLLAWQHGHAAARSALPPGSFGDLAFRQHPGADLPRDVRLRDEQGRAVVSGDLFAQGRPVVLAFDYFRCETLCGVVLGNLATALAQVPLKAGADYGVVAVSIDPGDAPADAAALKASHFDRDPAFAEAARFLVGAEPEVRRLADAAGFPYRFDPATGQYAHPAGAILISSDGRISRYILGIGYDPLDLRLGLIDASRGVIGSVKDHLLLLCYGYDPAQGKYTAMVGNLVRAGGFATVVALGLLIFFASRGTGRT
jgi:protein SCO1/2